MADAPGLGPGVPQGRGGSTPLARIISLVQNYAVRIRHAESVSKLEIILFMKETSRTGQPVRDLVVFLYRS